MCYSQRQEVEDRQQSSHKEQVDALWSRLEAASEAHKQQVQQLQEVVVQLEQRDTDRSQVSEHLLQVASQTAQFPVQIGQVKSTGQATSIKLVHVQVQQQLEAQQAQHAAQVEDMSSKAAQMESLIRQATELDQQHVFELNARETDLDELRQVSLCMSSLQLASCDAASSYSVN